MCLIENLTDSTISADKRGIFFENWDFREIFHNLGMRMFLFDLV